MKYSQCKFHQSIGNVYFVYCQEQNIIIITHLQRVFGLYLHGLSYAIIY